MINTGFWSKARTIANTNSEHARLAKDRFSPLSDIRFDENAKVRPKGSQSLPQPVCTGPIAWKDFDAIHKDIDNLKAATSGCRVEEVFMTSFFDYDRKANIDARLTIRTLPG